MNPWVMEQRWSFIEEQVQTPMWEESYRMDSQRREGEKVPTKLLFPMAYKGCRS